jgi:hypothetical protein
MNDEGIRKMRTRTKFFDFSRLAIADGSSTVVRIAMVCNDLALANSLLGQYKEMKSGMLSHIQRGARMYLVRMSCGHLREGIFAINDVKDHSGLSALVAKCHARTQSAFAALCECLPGGKDHTDFERYIKPIRDKIGFHYDPKEVAWAMEHSAKAAPVSFTIGEDIHSCRFEFADEVIEVIVCRRLWQIPLDKDVRVEADRIADWCFQKSVQFLDFSEDFVGRFLAEHAA